MKKPALISLLLVLLFCASLGGAQASGMGGKEQRTPEGTPYTWFNGGREETVWKSDDEVAVFFEPRSRTLDKEMKRISEALKRNSSPLKSSNEFVMFSKIDRNVYEKKRSTLLEDFSEVKEVSPVFYRGKKDFSGRMALTGEIIVHFKSSLSKNMINNLAKKLDLSLIRTFNYSPNTYLFRANSAMESLKLANEIQKSGNVLYSYPNWYRVMIERSTPNDPLFGDQWHLQNTGQGGGTEGEDVNIISVWDYYKGSVNEIIAIVDNGLEVGHEDLSSNVLSGYHWNWVSSSSDPSPGPDDNHGTSVAGVAAARGFNALGVCGAAPEAGLVGYRLLGAANDTNIADAMTKNKNIIDISNNSWGPPDDGKTLEKPDPLIEAALKDGVTTGRNGKGIIYVFAGGNGDNNTDNSNYDGFANSRYTIAVAASDAAGMKSSYSELGANIFINAPSSSSGSGSCAAMTALKEKSNYLSYGSALYAFRDKFLNSKRCRKKFIKIFYENSYELSYLMVKDESFRSCAYELIDTWMPAINSLTHRDRENVLTIECIRSLRSFTDYINRLGSPKLKQDIISEVQFVNLNEFLGKSIQSLWQDYESKSLSNKRNSQKVSKNGCLPGITTTDRTGEDGYDCGNYTYEFGGTSSSAPLVSGIVALMLQANPNLTWRDVQYIILKTAEKNDPCDGDWTTNGAGYNINHKYGFGRIDAQRAVETAKNWISVSPEITVQGSVSPNQPIPDNDNNGVSSSIAISENIQIEYVDVFFTATDHPYWGDLEITLNSPSGTTSILSTQHVSEHGAYRYDNWRFASVRHFEESSQGTWTLTVKDLIGGDTGTFQSWGLKIYGTNATPPTTSLSINPSAPDGLNDWYKTIPSVTLTSSEQPSTTYYRIDSATTQTYSAPFTVPDGDHTLYYQSVDESNNLEQLRSYPVKVDTAPPSAPTASPTGAPSNHDVAVSLSCTDTSAQTFYTLDGSTPNSSSTLYSLPITLTSTTTLKAIAIDPAGNPSPITSETYTIDKTPPSTPAASPTGALLNHDVAVSLSCTDTSAQIRYTLDGSDPNSSSALYSLPITLTSTTTLRAIAIDPAGNASPITSETYTIDKTPPSAPAASPTGSLTNKDVAVSLSCTDSSAQIRYTLDGSTPNASSTLYASPITITSTTTLKAIAIDPAGNASPITSETYTIDKTPPSAPAISSRTHSSKKLWYKNNSPAFSWSATDLSGIEGYSFAINQNPSTEPATVLEVLISKSYPVLRSGIWYFHIKAMDKAGNWGDTAHFLVKIDSYKPKATIGAKSFSRKKPGTTIRFSLIEFGATKVKATLRIRKGKVIKALFANRSYVALGGKGKSYSVKWNGKDSKKRVVAAGKYTIELTLNDLAGNKNLFKKSLKVSN